MAEKKATEISPGEAIVRHAERKNGEPIKIGDAIVYTGAREGMVMVATPRGEDWQAPEPPEGEGIL